MFAHFTPLANLGVPSQIWYNIKGQVGFMCTVPPAKKIAFYCPNLESRLTFAAKMKLKKSQSNAICFNAKKPRANIAISTYKNFFKLIVGTAFFNVCLPLLLNIFFIHALSYLCSKSNLSKLKCLFLRK